MKTHKVPGWLDAEGKAFWRRHYAGCVANGSLSDDTVDSFALACRLWSLIQSTDPNIDSKHAMKLASMLKYFSTLAKPFGLLGSKPPAGPAKASIADIIRQAVQGPPTASTGQPGAKDAH